MNKLTRFRVLNFYLPIALAVILLAGAAWFMASRNRRPAFGLPQRAVIDSGALISKGEDKIEILRLPAAGGSKEMVRIRFFWEQDGYTYNDALILTPQQYAQLTPDQIQTMEKQRFENWVKTVNGQSSSN